MTLGFGIIGTGMMGGTYAEALRTQTPHARLVAVDLANPAQSNWKDLIPEPKEEVLEFSDETRTRLQIRE